MEIRERILSDMKMAMKEKNQVKLDTIRFLQSAIKNKEIDSRPNPITSDDVMNVIKKLVKQRKESIEQFVAAGRSDLADKETGELKILETYLPQQMGAAELEKIVIAAISESGAKTAKEMGAVMKLVMAKTQGSADNKMISELVKAKLS